MSSIEAQANQSAVDDEDTSSSHVRRPLSRPRPRPVLSCLRCRRRKIKCDRLLPCRQCTLTGHDRQCSYGSLPIADEAGGPRTLNGSVSGQALTHASPTDLVDSNHQAHVTVHSESEVILKAETLISLQQRLQKLERLCTTHSCSPVATLSCENDGRETDDHLPKVDAALSIKVSGPRYHSQSYKKSLLHHFGVVNHFCHSGFDDPERAPVMNELRMYHDRCTKTRRKRDNVKPASCILSSILELLPSRTVCDESVHSYFRTFEKCMRVLHYPSFKDECQHFWGSKETLHQAFKSFVPQLAVVVAIMQALEGVSNPENDDNIRVGVLCGHVEAWLDSLTGRGQLTMATLRTRALLILAQQVRAVQADEVWKATGKLLRSAMMAGLHRDPSEFPDIHVFEGELRRRLWMTIVEMDLEASLVYGMPIMLHEGDFTCKVPSNVDDLDLFEGLTELPVSKPLKQQTDSIFQVALAGSLALRLQAIGGSTTLPNNIPTYLHTLEKYTQGLPSNLHLDRDTKEDFEQIFGVVMLNVYIRRFLSHWYRSSISLTDVAPGTITTGLQHSLSILSYQKLFDPESLGSNSDQCGRYWDLFHILCKSDIMQAALDVCIHAQVQGLVSWTNASLLLAIDDTTATLMRRISRNGSDIKDILRLSITSQLLKSQIMQANREDMMKEGAHNVLMACRRATRQEEICVGEDRNEKDIQSLPSLNTQLHLENGTTSVDWTTMPHDPSLTNNDLGFYFDTDGQNFDLLSDYTLENTDSNLWNQY